MAEALIYVVEPDPVAQVLLNTIFGDAEEVAFFRSAETCLERIGERKPDVVMTDVTLPGIDGFELCFQLKHDQATSDIKLLVVSAQDDLESRLHAYDLGVDDYVLKPFAVDEIRRKVVALRRMSAHETAVGRLLADSEQLTGLLLSNMDEYAVLIKFMRSLNACGDEREAAEVTLGMLKGYGLDGIVEIRQPDMTFCLGEHGENVPRDVAVLAHIKGMDRVFSFMNRTIVNYDRVTVLVNNMPVDDGDLCGRLRDHLAIAAETADGKLSGLYLARRDSHVTHTVTNVVADIRGIIGEYVGRQHLQNNKGAEMVTELIQALNVSFSGLALQQDLEEQIEEMIRRAANSIISIYDGADDSARALADLEQRLAAVL